MSEKGVTTVLTGNCGPNAFNVFGQAGIEVIAGISGPVRNAAEQFKTGVFPSASAPNVASHSGMNATQGEPPPRKWTTKKGILVLMCVVLTLETSYYG